MAVLHYKPSRSLFRHIGPDYFAAITDAWVIYPWEVPRDLMGIPSVMPDL